MPKSLKGFDFIGVSACAVIHDGKGNILLMKRGPEARDERGRWDICGGGIKFGETTENATVREINEELCVEPISIEFLGAYDAHRIIEDKKSHWIALIHAVKVDPKKVRIGEPEKISEIAWFNSANLPIPLHSQFPKAKSLAMKYGHLK